MTPEREREIAAEARKLVTEELGVSLEQATDEARIIDDLRADSLDTVELAMEIEERFNISIPDVEAQTLPTVGDIIACVIRKIRELEEKGGAN